MPATRQIDRNCELCREDGGAVLWRDGQLRIVAGRDPEYPGYVCVIWNDHVREWGDLEETARDRIQRVLLAAERALRRELLPEKMNLASLGNLVPHLHWHVIPRFRDDPHFPQPIWGLRQREPDAGTLARRRARLPAVWAALAKELEAP